jgi:hypothetical protein
MNILSRDTLVLCCLDYGLRDEDISHKANGVEKHDEENDVCHPTIHQGYKSSHHVLPVVVGQIAVNVINRMTALGTPESAKIVE